MRVAILVMFCVLSGCDRYRDFTLPPQTPGVKKLTVDWLPRPEPVLSPGAPGSWDAVDVLNPSVLKVPGGFFSLYSGFDGQIWRTGSATSPDGFTWKKLGPVLSPSGPDRYIAANGSVIEFHGARRHYYQVGRTPSIVLDGQPVLQPGPYGSWDERGVADPYAIALSGKLYLYYLGMDRARRQRLGLAVSDDGVAWYKLRSNPVLELGGYGAFDENGLGEPAVWASHNSYWMLYTGRARNEKRRLGIARSPDGVHWSRLPQVFEGAQPWNSQVLCDPTVVVEGDRIRVWFGGGDVPRPDENLHGQIGYAELRIHP